MEHDVVPKDGSYQVSDHCPENSKEIYMPSALPKLTVSSRTMPGNSNVAQLEQEVLYLRQELEIARKQIRKLQDHEKQLRERLMDQAQQQFQMGNEQFEDVSLGLQRPTELIRRYNNLYLDSRVDALDSLDLLAPLKALDVLKCKILFSVIVLSFKAAQQNVKEMRGQVRRLLCLPEPSVENRLQQHTAQLSEFKGQFAPMAEFHTASAAAAEMEHNITSYLCKTVDTIEVAEVVFEVCQQIYATLYDYPCLKACSGLLDYVSRCVRVAWGLCVQHSPYMISFESEVFNESVHTRFHTSNPKCDKIQNYVWPALLDAHGTCVSKAVVVT